MQAEPYSIYIDQRPLKVAFLVDRAKGPARIDEVIAYNRQKWGGRYNAIFLTDGTSIEDDQWKLLRDYDPDIIKARVALSKEVRTQINVFLSPLSVELHEEREGHIDLRDDPLSLLPSRQLIAEIARDFSDRQSTLVLFELAENASPVIRDFITRNFGVLNPAHQVFHIRRALDEVKTSVHNISDEASLNDALSELGDYRRVVFPSQLCSVPNYLKDARLDREGARFALIVGDSSDELAYFWNRTLTIPHWLRTGITQLWLPMSLANDEVIRPGLTRFLNRFVDTTGNQWQRGAHFVSFSLKEEELRAVSESFAGHLRFPRTIRLLSSHPAPTREGGDSFSVKRGLQLYRAHSTEEHLVLSEPHIPEGSVGGQNWIVDVAIQFRPERFANIIGQDYWWRLPNRNNVLYETHLFNRPARVRADRGLSVLMARRSTFTPEAITLVVKLPDDFSIAYSLVCGKRFDDYDDDEGDRETRPYHAIERSDKGMYLSGVLSLFPDLLNAHGLFEDRFWRMAFARMANQSDRKDLVKKSEIVSRLKKQLPDWKDLATNEEQLQWWAERVLSIAKDYTKEEKELPFAALYEDAVAETTAYNSLHPKGPLFEIGENDFKRAVSRLLSWNVLLQGIRPKCPRCGYRIWYHIDKASQNIECEGCGYTYTVGSEERWYYRLNSLVRAAVSSHGTMPLLLVLGQLMRDARTSFMFSPCVDLLRQSKNDLDSYERVGELDLLCIVDGRLTIGEVKTSVGLFDRSDFDAMAVVAKAIKPDVLLFSALHGKPTSFVQQNIDRLQEELQPLEINVRWYALHSWVTEPRPVR